MKVLPFSPQSIAVYRLLLKHHRLSAKEISKRLNILPQAVYRAIQPFEVNGLVKKISEYPIKFELTPPSSFELFFQIYRQTFLKEIGNVQGLFPTNPAIDELLDILFIPNRESLLKNELTDLKNTQQSAHLISSGLEAPAEIVYEIKKAVDRRVDVKVLVQQVGNYNKEIFANLTRMGIKIKSTSFIKARIFLFDQKVCYLLSYNQASERKTIGIRLSHPPFAHLLEGLFWQQWEKGIVIDPTKLIYNNKVI